MTNETREQIALFRYRLISPVLAEPARIQNEYFRKVATEPQAAPGHQARKVAVSTCKRWLRLFRRDGFDALKPHPRSDRGRPRKLQGDAWARVKTLCEAHPQLTMVALYALLREQSLLGEAPIAYNTFALALRREGVRKKGARADARKRYETEAVNALWICDFMHGPVVRIGAKSGKAILCAIMDDHSRMIVGHAFSAHETIGSLTIVLKDALLAYGVPKRFYVDNGPAFAADLLAKACAQAGISLTHSKPYDPPSRGKIERFFRTVRERFLPGLQGTLFLDDLNFAFKAWLQEQYHHHHHSGIDQTPIDRYHASLAKVDLRRLAKPELDEIFLVRHERIVNNDATISFKGKVYEVPCAYIRQKVELRHLVDDPDDLALFDQGARVAQLKLVDVHENARTFKPSQAQGALSYAHEKVAP